MTLFFLPDENRAFNWLGGAPVVDFIDRGWIKSVGEAVLKMLRRIL